MPVAVVFLSILIWVIIYYHNGSYINYGIGAVYGLLLWIPVLPNGAEVSKRTLQWVRIVGIILILIGIFTRVHY